MIADPNLSVYNRRDVAEHYAGLDYLTPCEQLLFQTYLRSGMSVLDLGVGGGRTTPYLSSIASRYVGVDYAEEMIASCRKKFPELEFRSMDAADLSIFPDQSFEAVVMAFNGMDYVIPDRARICCLLGIKRVLVPGGVLIFSSHNPRSIFIRPSWNEQRIKVLSDRIAGRVSIVSYPLRKVLTMLRVVAALVKAMALSLVRGVQRFSTRAFWAGDGYLFDPAHGGLRTHCAVPERIKEEVTEFGFRMVRILGDDYPRASHKFATDWYYYVFVKDENLKKAESCN